MKMEDGIHVDARDDHTEYFNRSIREEVRVSVDTTHRDKQELPKLPKLKVLAASMQGVVGEVQVQVPTNPAAKASAFICQSRG